MSVPCVMSWGVINWLVFQGRSRLCTQELFRGRENQGCTKPECMSEVILSGCSARGCVVHDGQISWVRELTRSQAVTGSGIVN